MVSYLKISVDVARGAQVDKSSIVDQTSQIVLAGHRICRLLVDEIDELLLAKSVETVRVSKAICSARTHQMVCQGHLLVVKCTIWWSCLLASANRTWRGI